MLQTEIDALVERTLAVIGKGNGKNTKYFFQAESGLSTQEWQVLNRRLNELGLTNSSVSGAIELNAQGSEIAKSGSYRRFLEDYEKRQSDQLVTNRYARLGFWVALAALVVAAITLMKPDNNEASIKKMQVSQQTDSAELASLKIRVDTLAQQQHSVINTDTASKRPANPHPLKPQSHAPATPHRHVPNGRLPTSK